MSLYIKVQLSFWKHRKTLRLRALLGDAAFVVPLRLWSYAAENQPDGDFNDYSAQELAMLVAYEGDAQAMLEALQQAGWMDGMKIHDWEDHNHYHVVFAERAKHAAEVRWEAQKEKKQKKEDKKRKEKTERGQEPSIASSISKAKALSEEEVISYCLERKLQREDGVYCWNKWESNGWTIGGDPIRDWRAAVRTWQAHRYLPSLDTRNGQKPQQTKGDPDELTGRPKYLNLYD